MQDTGCWSKHQQMGRRWPVGCVALEITQRCNLDCTLCYLSEYSEAVRDIPLDTIFQRIDAIYRLYGPGTDIQVTGGDPTLRKRHELIAIIRCIHEMGMRSTLMTNGILASRSLLQELADAGLNDVAFHVDTTQKRKGFGSERELDLVREKYLGRTHGLGLSVMFNTTVHDDNYHEIPDLVRFFVRHADCIRTASFQLQADTGRGTKGKRGLIITPGSVWQQIESGVDSSINHNAMKAGHYHCNRYGMGLVVNQRFHDLLDDTETVGELHAATADITADRNRPRKTVLQFSCWLLKHPHFIAPVIRWSLNKLVRIKYDLIRSRGRFTTLSFFVHNFMDAKDLDPERIRACVFKIMTNDGPVSMCEYNAHRDDFILQPVAVKREHTVRFWNPLSGETGPFPADMSGITMKDLPPKKLKGRTRRYLLPSG